MSNTHKIMNSVTDKMGRLDLVRRKFNNKVNDAFTLSCLTVAGLTQDDYPQTPEEVEKLISLVEPYGI